MTRVLEWNARIYQKRKACGSKQGSVTKIRTISLIIEWGINTPTRACKRADSRFQPSGQEGKNVEQKRR